MTPVAGRERVLAQLADIEATSGSGTLHVARTTKLNVSNLGKLFFPADHISKGDVMRYYVDVAPYVLPLLEDRALTLKRFPNGINAPFFYQQKAPTDPPAAVRVEAVLSESGEEQVRIIGGNLTTLLYCVQLGAIELNPWNARVGSLEFPDYTIIDLDPGPRAPFTRTVDVALWVKEQLDTYGLHAGVKTSGSTGIHIGIPLPPRTSEETAMTVSQRIATTVASAHPRDATIERGVKARGTTTVYVDYGQNARGKTVASAYSVRAKKGAPVSTPLAWEELTHDLDPALFTLRTVPERIARVGDLWAAAFRTRNSAKALQAVLSAAS